METLALTPAQLGMALRNARKAVRLSQKSAGAKVGMKQSTVSVMETDCARTSVESLYKLLSALDLELVIRSRPNNDGVQEPVEGKSRAPVEW